MQLRTIRTMLLERNAMPAGSEVCFPVQFPDHTAGSAGRPSAARLHASEAAHHARAAHTVPQARSPLMASLAALALLATAVPARAELQVRMPNVEQGEFELEHNGL